MRQSHPAIRRSSDSVRVAMPRIRHKQEPEGEGKPSWRSLFLDADGNPLPAEGTRIDVTTGEKLGKVTG